MACGGPAAIAGSATAGPRPATNDTTASKPIGRAALMSAAREDERKGLTAARGYFGPTLASKAASRAARIPCNLPA
jgi:hypothetical protein